MTEILPITMCFIYHPHVYFNMYLVNLFIYLDVRIVMISGYERVNHHVWK